MKQFFCGVFISITLSLILLKHLTVQERYYVGEVSVYECREDVTTNSRHMFSAWNRERNFYITGTDSTCEEFIKKFKL